MASRATCADGVIAVKRRDFAQALVNVLTRYLLQRREVTLTQLEQTGECWDGELSARLEQVDEALVRLGYFDKT